MLMYVAAEDICMNVTIILNRLLIDLARKQVRKNAKMAILKLDG